MVPSLLLNPDVFGQEMMDVVYLKDGSKIVGTIIELVPQTSVTFEALDGTKYVFSWERVAMVTKEPVQHGLVKAKGLESWYVYWGLGYASATYPDWLESSLDRLGERPGANHVSLSLDILGFYWPLKNDRTLIGFIVNGVGDRYAYDGGATQVNLYLYSLSAMHFFGDVPGDGPFIRTDAGFAAMIMTGSINARSGLGLLLGGGYGIPVSDETRILLQISYAYRNLAREHDPSETYHALSISIGGLF